MVPGSIIVGVVCYLAGFLAGRVQTVAAVRREIAVIQADTLRRMGACWFGGNS